MGEEKRGRKGKRRGYEIKRRDRQTSCGLLEKERERNEGGRGSKGRGCAIEAEKFKYLYDGSLFRSLINGTEEGRCN